MERKESNLEVAREEKTRSVAEKKIGGVRVPFGVASRVVVVSISNPRDPLSRYFGSSF